MGVVLRPLASTCTLAGVGNNPYVFASQIVMNIGQQAANSADRRSFFKQALAGIISVILGLIPAGAGLAVFLDPLRRKSGASGAVRVASMEALPDDGIPRKFPVIAARVDAWNKFSETAIGAVYLRRTSDGKVQAFNVVCPHAGCFVDFKAEKDHYLCPCHNSTFTVTGSISDPTSPAPRGLDSLVVEVREGKEIWVKFQNYQAGTSAKIPVA
jgi:menaquinol-cytochrome c reductase iron-sulfur subunit